MQIAETESNNLLLLKEQYKRGSIEKPVYISKMHNLHQALFNYATFLPLTDIAKIEIEDNVLYMTSRQYGIKVRCDFIDQRTAPIETLNFGFYEPEESDMLFNLLSNDFTVLDIGANIGWYSLAIAKTVANSKVYAIEPIPANFASLQFNITLNQLQNIQAFNMGLSDKQGTFDFYVDPSMGVNASLCNVAERPLSEMMQVSCSVNTVDNFVTEHGLKTDFIKCDVEGAELLVFKGAEATLRMQQPIIFTELLRKWSRAFDYHPNDLIEYLRELGYQWFYPNKGRLAPFGVMDDATVQTNFFVLHQDKHAELIRQFAS